MLKLTLLLIVLLWKLLFVKVLLKLLLGLVVLLLLLLVGSLLLALALSLLGVIVVSSLLLLLMNALGTGASVMTSFSPSKKTYNYNNYNNKDTITSGTIRRTYSNGSSATESEPHICKHLLL